MSHPYVELPDGQPWPNPGDPLGIEQKLRSGAEMTQDERTVAASFILAFRLMIVHSKAKRDWTAKQLMPLALSRPEPPTS